MGFAPFLQSVTHIVQLEKFKNLSNIYLSSIADRIFQGLVTGADKVFIIDNPADIEPGILKPLLRTNSLAAYEHPTIRSWILFPYRIEQSVAKLLSADEIRTAYPNAWQYLKANEKTLKARERGKWNHAQWYAFGRSQNLAQMDDTKLIVQVMALTPNVN